MTSTELALRDADIDVDEDLIEDEDDEGADDNTLTMDQVTAPVDSQPQRRHPWADLATILGDEDTESLTSEEMLKKAGLDWEVGIRPLWRKMANGEMVQHSKSREVYRLDNEEELGLARGRYNIFNNREAFAFGDSIVADGNGKWITAGEQGGGRRVFMTMKLGGGFTVLGEDAYDMFLFIRTSHGDGTSVIADVVPFRAFCLNQSQLANSQHKTRWSVPHTTNISGRLEEAREALQISDNYTIAFREMVENMATTTLTDEMAKRLIESVIPERRSRREKIVEEILNVYHTSPTVEGHRGTAYGLVNGLTEYMDHVKTQRSGNARFESIMYGEGATFRNNLVQRVLALD